MVFWLITLAIAIFVTVILLAAARKGSSESDIRGNVDSDIAVYKDQLSEVNRDLARGVLSNSEAEQVRLEISRRILEADKRQESAKTIQTDNPRAAILILSVIVLFGSVAIYAGIGAPGYSDLPIKS
ncbi:MAG: c-type cytochrome biogenesis protein CcmI, partial [Boseongicola sp.]